MATRGRLLSDAETLDEADMLFPRSCVPLPHSLGGGRSSGCAVVGRSTTAHQHADNRARLSAWTHRVAREGHSALCLEGRERGEQLLGACMLEGGRGVQRERERVCVGE